MRFLFYIGIILGLCSVAIAQDDDCILDFRPKTNETAFVSVGSSLKIADKHCFVDSLLIPYTQQIKAVNLPAGEYKAKSEQNLQDIIRFEKSTTTDQNVQSCSLCDPILELQVLKTQEMPLVCVLSSFKLRSCAPKDSLSFTLTKRENIEENLCVPSLVYYGREGSLLRFGINDCQTNSLPKLSYDLQYGNIIQFLDEQYAILSADNIGIYYQRLEVASKRKLEL